MSVKERFYSKILLFGEYAVICNSMGLTLPFKYFSGALYFCKSEKDQNLDSNTSLRDFWQYLNDLDKKGELIAKLDLTVFEKDLNKGLQFNSNIPQGFGVGSSGALTAAIYDKYKQHDLVAKMDTDEALLALKEIFVQMESYFHGVSSGLDPLNCFIQHPLLIKDKSNISLVDIPQDLLNERLSIFLIDTGTAGKTEPLVNLFFDKCRQQDFYKKLRKEFIPLNDQCIQSFIKGDSQTFFESLEALSRFLLLHFKPMIPKDYINLWKQGLERSLYHLKLCGSGGGGFLLGFTQNLAETRIEMEKQGIEIILVD